MLFALITSQLVIVGQLGRKVYHRKLNCLLEVENNRLDILEGNDLADKAARN